MRRFPFILAGILGFRCFSAIAQEASPPRQLPAPRVILSLAFRGTAAKDPLSVLPQRLRNIGHFQLQNEEESLFRGEMIGVDSRNLFFFDPVNPKLAMLREVTPKGQVVRQWKLPDADSNYQATIQENRFIWLKTTPKTFDNFPVLIYDKRQSTPVSDWRKKPPFDLPDFLRRSIGPKKLDAMNGKTKEGLFHWMATVTSSANNAFVLLENGGGGPYKTPKINLSLTMSNDGKRLVKLQKVKGGFVNSYTVSVGGKAWNVETDINPQTWRWQNLWVCPYGQPRGKPLLTCAELTRPNGQWQKLFPFKTSQPPPGVTITENGSYVLEFGVTNLLVALNPQKQVIGYWKTHDTSSDNWVELGIAPAQGGFYRQERTATHLMIYYHPFK